MESKSVAFVVDASAIIRIMDLREGVYYTTQRVLDELKYESSKARLSLVDNMISVIQPSKESLGQVMKAASEIGLLNDLSQTDVELVAIAEDLSTKYDKVIVVTDDLKIQNLAAYLCLDVRGIRKKIRWVIIRKKKCLFCGVVYNYALAECPDCGATKYRPIIVRLKLGDVYEQCTARREQTGSSKHEY